MITSFETIPKMPPSFISASSATAVIEAALAITYPKTTPVVFARQQIISCVNNAVDPAFAQGLGCGGGNSDDAFAFMAKYTFLTVSTMCPKAFSVCTFILTQMYAV